MLYAGGFYNFLHLSCLLPLVSCAPWRDPFHRPGDHPDSLSDVARKPQHSGCGHCSLGVGHTLSRDARVVWPTQEDRPMDPADLALCFHHRRGGLLDALSPLSIALKKPMRCSWQWLGLVIPAFAGLTSTGIFEGTKNQ